MFSDPFIAGDQRYYSENQIYSIPAEDKARERPPSNTIILRELKVSVDQCCRRTGKKVLDVLDFGMGSGFYAGELIALEHKVLGVDFNSAMVEIAKKYFGVEAICIEHFSDLNTLERKFDFVV